MDETELEMIGRLVAKARGTIAEQERLIARLRGIGADTLRAEETLHAFKSHLAFCEGREQKLRTKSDE